MLRNNNTTPWELAELPGKRMTVLSEIEEGRRLREGTIKDLTGKDTMTVQRKREHPFEFRPQHKLWLYGNHKPRISGTDNGIWRRILLVPFLESFEGRKDKSLEGKLLAELPGILAWAVHGAVQWYRDGLQAPDKVVEATQEYREESDVLSQFVRDCCVILPKDKFYPTNLLKKAYEEYTGAKVSPQRFGQMLSDAGYEKAGRQTWGGNQQRCFHGLALANADDDPPTDDDPPSEQRRQSPREPSHTQESMSSGDLPHTNGKNGEALDILDRENTINAECIFSHEDNPKSMSSMSSMSSERENTNNKTEKQRDYATAEAGAAPELPEGWHLVKCDHKGNVTRFGEYWRAVRNDGAMTEPTQYPDSAVRQAQRE
jgi:phage/plasmid-associated DNA primase